MSPFHPTKRDLLLVLSCFLVLGLFLQFDFSLRFDYSQNGRTKHGSAAWEQDRQASGKHDKFLEDVKAGAKASEGRIVAGMTESKVRWGDEGAVRTAVLGHAPGTSCDHGRDGIADDQDGPSSISCICTMALGSSSPTSRRTSRCCV